MKLSVCIATYRRNPQLTALLADLVSQRVLPDEIVVVDNDADGGARPVVEQRRTLGCPCPIHYDIQPLKNISLTRNRTVELASGDWIAFVDDDERAPVDWLERLLNAADRFVAQGVLGPVVPVVPADAPSWIQRGSFYDWARLTSGTVVPLNKLRFGNVLLRAALLRTGALPFDPAYGLTGGEDGDLLTRLVQSGTRIVWCDEAQVTEPVEPARLSLRWLLRRALRGGQDFARHALAGRYGKPTPLRRMTLFVRALLQAVTAMLLALLCLPLGLHRVAYWLTKFSANLGKLSVLWGWHYREYA
jgi:succinoglycan biosynthesis protein ExoM